MRQIEAYKVIYVLSRNDEISLDHGDLYNVKLLKAPPPRAFSVGCT